jgi:oligopeptide transport system substrate-binding protein
MYIGLTRTDQRSGESRLDLAKSLDVSPDGLTWTFVLRDARWSDGQRITAGDVAYGINRSRAGASDGVHSGPGPDLLAIIESVEAVDRKTVRIRVRQPASWLFALLGIPTARPVRRDVAEGPPEVWTDPTRAIVSGAYKLGAFVPGTTILVKNDEYYAADHVEIERIVFEDQGVRTPEQIRARYAAGEFDLVRQPFLGPILAAKIDPLYGPDLNIEPTPGTSYLPFNTAYGPTTNLHVRRALSQATDRAALAATFAGDATLATRTLTPDTIFGGVPRSDTTIGLGFSLDAARAERALAGAAFPSSIAFTVPNRPGTNGPGRRLALAIKAHWENAFATQATPFTVEIDEVWPPFVLFQRMLDPDPSVQRPVSRAGWVADYLDANNFLNDLVLRSGFLRWSDAEFGALVSGAEVSRDPAARIANYRAAEQILCGDEAVIIPLFNLGDQFVARTDVLRRGTRFEDWAFADEADHR